MIPRARFARVLALVEESGAAADAEALLRPPAAGGRPRQISFAVFLTAVIVAAEHTPNLALVNVHKVLTVELARSYQIALNIIETRPDGSQHVLTLRQVRYMLEALERKVAFTQGRAPELSDEDRADRSEALQNIVDLLVDATTKHLPAADAYSLDGTALESWAVGRSRKTVSADADHAPATPDAVEVDDGAGQASEDDGRTGSFDPDAAWGYQTKTYDNRSNACFGYHVFALAGVPAVGADRQRRPTLVERFTLRPANANAVEPSLELLDSLRAAGRTIATLLSDREFTYKKAESWADPLRKRGIAQVIDMHEGDRGARDYNGIAMIDGTPHCLAVLGDRDHLVRITRPPNLSPGRLKAGASEKDKAEHAARVAEIEQFRAKIAEREVAAFRRVSGPDASGKERWECPAQAGKVKCANCPLSMHLPEGTPTVPAPHAVPALPTKPVKPGKDADADQRAAYEAAKAAFDEQADFLRCCRQRTVTIPGHVTPKLRQQLYWGSDAWIASYSRRGSSIEGAFGNLKSTKTAGVKRGWIFVVGIVKTTMMLAAAIVASNIRLLRTWAERTGDRTHPITEADVEHHGFEELDADGNPDLALAPPTAA